METNNLKNYILCASHLKAVVTLVAPQDQGMEWLRVHVKAYGGVILPYRTRETGRVIAISFRVGTAERAQECVHDMAAFYRQPDHVHGYINEEKLDEPSEIPPEEPYLITDRGCSTGLRTWRRGRIVPIMPPHLLYMAEWAQFTPDYWGRRHYFCGRSVHHCYWEYHLHRCGRHIYEDERPPEISRVAPGG